MKDDFYPGAGLGAGCRIGEVALDELHCFEANQIGTLAGNEIVDATNCFTVHQEGCGNRTADKPGDAGYKIACQEYSPPEQSDTGARNIGRTFKNTTRTVKTD